MKKTGLNWYVYDFSADYDVITVYDKSDIHKYLMKKNDMTKNMFRNIKKVFVIIMSFSVVTH